MSHNYTVIRLDTPDDTIVQCNDCGAYAPGVEGSAVVHHSTCTPTDPFWLTDCNSQQYQQ